MRLLIVTQKVDQNDPILGFFHAWIREFAAHFDTMTVICLEEGGHQLPGNVRVLSLGKEKKSSVISHQSLVESKFKYILTFYRYIWSQRKNYDAVFVHMNPIYVVLGGLLWKILRKNIYLWYVHRSVDMKLRVAALFVDRIFTAAKESCRLSSSKISIVGHGIEADRFTHITKPLALPSDAIRIVHVGRITKIKNCDTLIIAADILARTWNRACEVVFVGDPVTPDDHEYKKMLEGMIGTLNLSSKIRFAGPVPNSEIADQYAQADLTVNLAPTGGVDKVVLESLASGTPVFFSNAAFIEIVAPYQNMFHVAYRDAGMLAEKIRLYAGRADASSVETVLRGRIAERFSIGALISRISLNIHDASK